jgi:hypothetical protein
MVGKFVSVCFEIEAMMDSFAAVLTTLSRSSYPLPIKKDNLNM